jgi:hypothetical protein
VYQTQYVASEETSLVVKVAEALAAVRGTDPMEMSPLYDTVDGETLNRFLDHETDEAGGSGVLSVHVDGWNVFVRDDGVIRVCDADVRASPAPVFTREMSE